MKKTHTVACLYFLHFSVAAPIGEFVLLIIYPLANLDGRRQVSKTTIFLKSADKTFPYLYRGVQENIMAVHYAIKLNNDLKVARA